MAQRHLSEAPLRVSSELWEAPLASPLRRALALAFDFVLLVVPSVIVASGAALLALRLQEPAAFRALRTMVAGEARPGPAYDEALAALAPLLVRLDVDGLPPEVAIAVERGDRGRAAELLRETDLIFDFALGGSHTALEPGSLRIPVDHFLPPSLRAVASYGVMAIYFGLLTARPPRPDAREMAARHPRGAARRPAAAAPGKPRALRRLPPHPRHLGHLPLRPLARPQPPHAARPRGAHGGDPHRTAPP